MRERREELVLPPVGVAQRILDALAVADVEVTEPMKPQALRPSRTICRDRGIEHPAAPAPPRLAQPVLLA